MRYWLTEIAINALLAYLAFLLGRLYEAGHTSLAPHTEKGESQ